MAIYKYQGEEFEVDDSAGRYVEVKYRDQVGWVGINLQGTKSSPYTLVTERGDVEADGLNGPVLTNADLNILLSVLCDNLLRQHADEQSFEKEAACEEIHRFVKDLDQ